MAIGEQRVGKRAEQKRRWDTENRLRCACGRVMARKATHCVECEHDARRRGKIARWDRVAELWAAGRTIRQIAAELGTTDAFMRVDIHRAREAGWPIPLRLPRRTPASGRMGQSDA